MESPKFNKTPAPAIRKNEASDNSRDLAAENVSRQVDPLELLEFLTDFQSVERTIYVPKLERRENDTEHSYNLTMAAWLIAVKDRLPLDVDLVIKYSLVHDLVEVYAGDVSALDEEGRKTKAAKEKVALQQLKDNRLTAEIAGLIEEYERQDSQESRFVYALDKLMAKFMLIHGQVPIWRRHGITYDDWCNRFLANMQVSPHLQPYVQELLRHLEANSHLLAD